MGLRRDRGGERKKLLGLAGLYRHRLPELRADFRQYYSVGLGELGGALPVSEAADLAAQLPAGARCASPEGWAAGWGEAEWLLSRIDHALRVLTWQRTADAAEGRGFPDMLTPAPEPASGPSGGGMDRGELEEMLSRKRG